MLFKQSKKETCDACNNLEDADCLNLLKISFSSIDDLTEKLTLEKEILSHKYSCGASLSDESCLSYLDEKMGTLSNDDQLSLLTKVCYSGSLYVEVPASIPEESRDEDSTSGAVEEANTMGDGEPLANGEHPESAPEASKATH